MYIIENLLKKKFNFSLFINILFKNIFKIIVKK